MLAALEWWPVTAWAVHLCVALTLLWALKELDGRTATVAVFLCAIPLVNTVFAAWLVGLLAVEAIKEIL